MRFLVDMPLSPILSAWLRDQGHDAVHATESGLAQASDAEILDRALEQERIVVTADLDFPRLLAGLQATGPGLILLRGGNHSEAEARDCVRRVLSAIPEKEMPRSIAVVDREKIRRRWLPIARS